METRTDPIPETDELSFFTVSEELGTLRERITGEYRACVDSTSSELKKRADTLPEGYVLLADRQTGGRGRRGRSFFSPAGTGIYMSILLRPALPPEEAVSVTTAAAVAACRAIEECTEEKPSIKWVNDIFVRGKKVCGILTEGQSAPDGGTFRWIVLGVGFNVTPPEGGFPGELSPVAGSVLPKREAGVRPRLAAAFLRQFFALYDALPSKSASAEYRERCFLPGKEIFVLNGEEKLPARALDVDGECRLVVQYGDGRIEALHSGEVSVRIKE